MASTKPHLHVGLEALRKRRLSSPSRMAFPQTVRRAQEGPSELGEETAAARNRTDHGWTGPTARAALEPVRATRVDDVKRLIGDADSHHRRGRTLVDMRHTEWRKRRVTTRRMGRPHPSSPEPSRRRGPGPTQPQESLEGTVPARPPVASRKPLRDDAAEGPQRVADRVSTALRGNWRARSSPP